MTSNQFLSRLQAIRSDYAPYKVQEAYTSLLVVSLVLMVALMLYGVYLFPMAAMIGIVLGVLGVSAMIIFRIYQSAYTVINYLLKGN